MKTTIEIKLKPFKVPDFVLVDECRKRRQEGFVESRTFNLSEIDECTLSKMCNDFRNEVFKKAGKNPPPESA